MSNTSRKKPLPQETPDPPEASSSEDSGNEEEMPDFESGDELSQNTPAPPPKLVATPATPAKINNSLLNKREHPQTSPETTRTAPLRKKLSAQKLAIPNSNSAASTSTTPATSPISASASTSAPFVGPSPKFLLNKALALMLEAKDNLTGSKQTQVAEIATSLFNVLNNKPNPPSTSASASASPSETLLQQLFQEVKENSKAIAKITQAQSPLPTAAKAKAKATTYAQAAAANLPSSSSSSTKNGNSFTTVQRKKMPTLKENLQNRQLVLVTNSEEEKQQINSFELRNQINNKFKSTLNLQTPVIASIVKSINKKNIVLTTTTQYTADFLAENKAIWKEFFKFQRNQKVESWAQIIAHGVPFEPFLGENASQALKEEIEAFNNIVVKGKPRWISVRRENQQVGSIVFAVASEEERTQILKEQRITVAGYTPKVVKYLKASPTYQCRRCFKFGHPLESCRQLACCFCAAPHKTEEHKCLSCNSIGKACTHTIAKCINCKGSHFANSKDCEVLKAAKNIHQK